MIYIVGKNGNMGKRYAAILNYLDVEVCGHDLEGPNESEMKRAFGFIVATPTANHLDDMKKLFIYEKPILCEKPFTKVMSDLAYFEDKNRSDLSLVQMVNQYQFLTKPGKGETYYSYFKSGADGIHFDCINIIGLAHGRVALSNKSPIWDCMLNGTRLNLGMMDHAYIAMIKAWIKNPISNYAYARKAHEKVCEYISGNK